MKKWICLFLIYAMTHAMSYAIFSCSGDCSGNCTTWEIQYEVDCSGNILTFSSAHYFDDGTIIYQNEETAAGFIGMDPTSLNGDCETDVCI